MKYSEKYSKWIYDWPTIINDLEAGLYDKKGMLECEVAASDWVTCACGNQCDLLPRDYDGRPLDFDAWLLGNKFTAYIAGIVDTFSGPRVALGIVARHRAELAADARETLAAIDKRTAKVLAKMTAE